MNHAWEAEAWKSGQSMDDAAGRLAFRRVVTGRRLAGRQRQQQQHGSSSRKKHGGRRGGGGGGRGRGATPAAGSAYQLATVGYFSATVCLGTPPRPFELIVDTGSSITSVPCRQCTVCGAHRAGRRGRFDERASSTAERTSCIDPNLGCASCSRGGGCTYKVEYLEGSSLKGRVLRDTVVLAPSNVEHDGRANCANATALTATPSRQSAAAAAAASYYCSSTAAFASASTVRSLSAFRARTFFGCQTHETGKFREQTADGILGLQPDAEAAPMRDSASAAAAAAPPPSPLHRHRWGSSSSSSHRSSSRSRHRHHPSSRVPSVLDALVAHGAARRAFSLCLSSRAGLLLLGGDAPPEALARAHAAIARLAPSTTTSSASDRFSLELLGMRIEAERGRPPLTPARNVSGGGGGGGGGVGTSPRRYVSLPLDAGGRAGSGAAALVDSGTTFFFVPTVTHAAIRARLRRAAPELRSVGRYRLCARMSNARRDALPSIELVLRGSGGGGAAARHARLLVRPWHYMVRYPSWSSMAVPGGGGGGGGGGDDGGRAHVYCADIFESGPGEGAVLGASVLRHREIIFDAARSTIAFADADCDAVTPSTSLMRGAFTFAPCAAALTRNGTPVPLLTAAATTEHGEEAEAPSSSMTAFFLTSPLGVVVRRIHERATRWWSWWRAA